MTIGASIFVDPEDDGQRRYGKSRDPLPDPLPPVTLPAVTEMMVMDGTRDEYAQNLVLLAASLRACRERLRVLTRYAAGLTGLSEYDGATGAERIERLCRALVAHQQALDAVDPRGPSPLEDAAWTED